MKAELKQELEKVFREATSSDELFDTFQKALHHKLVDAELYKILLGNMILSADEVKMYTEKLCQEFRDICYDIYMWAASILENMHAGEHLETAFNYYRKAIEANRSDHLPYINILRMYNAELDLPPKKVLVELFRTGIKEVKYKSKLCRAIADFYGSLENHQMKHKYMSLAARYSRYE